MKRRALLFALLLAAGSAHAQSAIVTRATELQAQAQSDAATVAMLPENAKVDVLRRSGAWSEVKTATGQTGWVRMLSLRFEGSGGSAQQPSANPLGGLSNLLSSGRNSNTATVTTGVRGLTEEELQNARANPAELQKMQKFATDKRTAQAFAQRAKLSPAAVDYLPEPAAEMQPTNYGGN